MILRNGKKIGFNSLQLSTSAAKNNSFINSKPAKFSTFTRCLKPNNASAALIFNSKRRGYPQIYPCNAKK